MLVWAENITQGVAIIAAVQGSYSPIGNNASPVACVRLGEESFGLIRVFEKGAWPVRRRKKRSRAIGRIEALVQFPKEIFDAG